MVSRWSQYSFPLFPLNLGKGFNSDLPPPISILEAEGIGHHLMMFAVPTNSALSSLVLISDFGYNV